MSPLPRNHLHGIRAGHFSLPNKRGYQISYPKTSWRKKLGTEQELEMARSEHFNFFLSFVWAEVLHLVLPLKGISDILGFCSSCKILPHTHWLLKTQRYYFYSSLGPESVTGLTGSNPGLGRAVFLSGASGGESVSLLLQLLLIACVVHS